MRVIDSTLLHLIGQAFLADPYSPDRATLRWYVDPRLGLPRAPFVLERRPSLLRAAGPVGVPVSVDDANTLSPSGSRLVGTQVRVDLRAVTPEHLDLAFGPQPPPATAESLTIELRGGSAPAAGSVCWVRLKVGGSGGGPLLVAAQRDDRGQLMTLTRTSVAGPGTPVVLAAARMDRILLWGDIGDPLSLVVETVDVTGLDAAPGWGNRNLVPVVTSSHLSQLPNPPLNIEEAARAIVTPTGFPGPRAQHPLDESPGHDPANPNPATAVAVDNRYITPWLLRQEPAVARILAESAQPAPTGGRWHQSEIVESHALTHLGDDDPAAPQGVPPDLAATSPTFDYSLLHFLLLAGTADVQVAKLLGLAAVPEEPLLPGEPWDYRVVAEWHPDDLISWIGALRRQVDLLAARAAEPGIEASRKWDLERDVSRRLVELGGAVERVQQLLTAAGPGAPVSIAAFAFGVEMAARPPFDPPTGLSLTPRGSVRPGRRVGVVEVGWSLRPRYRTGDDRSIPCAAVISRWEPTSQRFLNPDNPDPMLPRIPQPILPAADDADPGGGGGTRVVDRTAALNTPLEYRVTECDPFGRWSAWASGTTQVDHQAPPNTVPCETFLEESPTTPGAYRLSVQFDWNPAATWDGGLVSGAPAQMSFGISVRRTLPAVPALRDQAEWTRLERTPGTGAGVFVVAGATAGLTTLHDGMTVVLEQPVAVVVENRPMRRYALSIDGIRLTPSAGGRVRCYTAIGTTHASEGPSAGVGVPALAEHIPTTPPSTPQMPADPLWGSWPDAENRSTVRLTIAVPDDGSATAVRYQILRAGENDVVAAARSLPMGDPRATARDQAHADYLAASTLAQRADALKRLAVLAEDVFTIDIDRLPAAPAGQPVTAVCELTASLRTLTLYCARGTSTIGNPSAWPTSKAAFAVVAVRRPAVPAAPVLLRGAPDGGGAELRIARPNPATAPVAAYELYRTVDPERAAAGDFRRLARVGLVSVAPATWQGPAGAQFGVLRDTPAQPDQRYFYVVVARGPGSGGGAGVRSRPSAVIGVDIGEPPQWVPLAGVDTAGSPALARHPAGDLALVVRDRNQRLRISNRRNGVWSDWQPVELPAGVTEVSSDPTVAWTGDGLSLVAAMPDGLLSSCLLTSAGSPTWEQIPGSTGLTGPALAAADTGLVLVAVDAKGQVRSAHRPIGASWSPWTTIGTLTGAGAPAVVAAAGSVSVAVVTQDGTAWYTWGSPGSWAPWTSLGGSREPARPALLEVPGTAVDVLVRDSVATLERRRLSQLTATAWEQVERRAPGPVAVVVDSEEVELVTVSANGTLLRRRIPLLMNDDPQS
jgi:hypothetical protein